MIWAGSGVALRGASNKGYCFSSVTLQETFLASCLIASAKTRLYLQGRLFTFVLCQIQTCFWGNVPFVYIQSVLERRWCSLTSFLSMDLGWESITFCSINQHFLLELCGILKKPPFPGRKYRWYQSLTPIPRFLWRILLGWWLVSRNFFTLEKKFQGQLGKHFCVSKNSKSIVANLWSDKKSAEYAIFLLLSFTWIKGAEKTSFMQCWKCQALSFDYCMQKKSGKVVHALLANKMLCVAKWQFFNNGSSSLSEYFCNFLPVSEVAASIGIHLQGTIFPIEKQLSFLKEANTVWTKVSFSDLLV